jgi:hypothetical protein
MYDGEQFSTWVFHPSEVFSLIRSLKIYNYNMRRISTVVKSYNIILQLLIYYFTGKYFLTDHLT